MTDEEFCSLPPGIALRKLLDCLDEETVGSLRSMPMPEAPRRAKYDAEIHGKAGYQYASETDLRGLKWWHDLAVKSAKREGNDYAARDEKKAANLAKWIAWREWYPDAVWSGIRGEAEVVAAPPSAKPRIHPRTGNGQRKAAAAPPQDEIDTDSY